MRGGSIVRVARLRAGLTQKELARRLGTSQPVVARMESGAVSPTLDTLGRAVAACGLYLHVLLTPDDDHDLGLALNNQRLTPEERLDQLTKGTRFVRELQDAAESRR